MFRRSSYAEVAAGQGGQQPHDVPPPRPRLGLLAHLRSGNSSRTNAAAMHPPYQPHRFSRSMDADSHYAVPSYSHSNHLERRSHLPPYPPQFGYSHASRDSAVDDASPPPFFVPSYLEGSRYAEKLRETHQEKMASQRDMRFQRSSAGPSLSTSSSGVSLHRTGPSFRALAMDVIERTPPLVDETVSSWPTRWNELDKYPQLDLEDDDRLVRFTHRAHDEAASVRADFPMPRQCGIYYYEVTIVSKSPKPMIGVGFSGPKVALTRIPGWEPDSYAYHSDDGQSFSNTTAGKNYGPQFGTLDIIGCGVNFMTNSAFFTKNGVYLGTAFEKLPKDRQYYPTVGMKKTGEALRVNFGQDPFAFDIDKMVQELKATIRTEISSHAVASPSPAGAEFDEASFMHELVSQYLTHDGYVETARAFAEEIHSEASALAIEGHDQPSFAPPKDDEDAFHRQKIRSAILEGDMDKAVKHTNAYYPYVLETNENIYFKLRCRKFIEMIRRANELNARLRESVPTPLSKRSTTSSGPNDDYDFEMELDEQLGAHEQSQWGSTAEGDNMDTEDELDHDDAKARLKRLTEDTIEYGMVLKEEFSNDPRREVKRALEDTFALIAYDNEVEPSLAPLLDKAGRGPVAEELNSAILAAQGKSPSAGLERLVQQTEVLVDMLAEDGGPGAFVNVQKDFLQ